MALDDERHRPAPIPWPRLARRYLRDSRRPLASLIVGLPLLLLYELGGRALGRQGAGALVAERLLIDLVAAIGPLLTWTPALLWIVTLIAWHRARRDALRVIPFVPWVMLLESLVLTIPLFVLGGFVSQMALAQAAPLGLSSRLLSAIGAGLYEELIFRCFLLLGLIAFLRAVGLPRAHATGIALVLSAAAFAGAHVAPIGMEPFNTPLLTVRLIAGLYLGYLFLHRGLGIATWTHVFYDAITVIAGVREAT